MPRISGRRFFKTDELQMAGYFEEIYCVNSQFTISEYRKLTDE